MKVAEVLDQIKQRFPGEPEYYQAVEEVLRTIEDEYNKHPEFEEYNLIERLCIPDRIVQFRVTWTDDQGRVRTNMGYLSGLFTKCRTSSGKYSFPLMLTM